MRVVHDHDDDAVLALLKYARRVCSAGHSSADRRAIFRQAGTARVTDAYFSMYFAAMGQGRMRTPDEIALLAREAGFGQPRTWRTDMPIITGLMTLRPM